MEMVAGLTAKFGPFCIKDFSLGVSSFLERLLTYLSWIIEEVEVVTAELKVLDIRTKDPKVLNKRHFSLGDKLLCLQVRFFRV